MYIGVALGAVRQEQELLFIISEACFIASFVFVRVLVAEIASGFPHLPY